MFLNNAKHSYSCLHIKRANRIRSESPSSVRSKEKERSRNCVRSRDNKRRGSVSSTSVR